MLLSRRALVFDDPAPAEIYTLSLHDALPIFGRVRTWHGQRPLDELMDRERVDWLVLAGRHPHVGPGRGCLWDRVWDRSEEHTSELQSLTNLVCRLPLEKKNRSRAARPSAASG